ncbi:alpha/beta fold hydrolase [Gloeocapsopsis sp. IPPAS B-1203]|uniref:alpha/beta hydrolase n=1 Tax=Gloeocapsopsis sp. IPPAS B-1203 TaxID=2049454 RepID=UPI000C17672E|nr:alpha/beta fold hydrolase [Gloeocapsopsis sp. IPPAS B-1203]PIG94103.1 alpha/beta hydrolase [Gloeocapsopsis sp. IPPAS B-1203]
MKRWRRLLLLLSILLIGLSWWGIVAARNGLVVRSLERDVPLLYLAPQQATAAPGVLIAHGYAGSKQLMLGYAHVLARAGYATMLWDFDGHGANSHRLQRFELQQNLNVALNALLEQPEVDSTRLALLGHSMGSGIVMNAGIEQVDLFDAAIAVSPTGASVTPQAPRNLQLQAGSWEGRFIANAERLLTASGGTNDNFAAGTARELVIVPNAEHITILFNDVSHQAALRWLNATFNQSSTSNYRDRRMAWYGLHLLGWLLLLTAVASSLVPRQPHFKKVPASRRWSGLLLAPLIAAGSVTLLNQGGIELAGLGGVQVGGAVSLWFFVAGITWLALLARLPRPTLRTAKWGLILFALLWIAFGAMAQVVWLQWWLIPTRLQIWLPLAVACLPWFLASGIAQQETSTNARFGWWFAQSVILIGGFLLTLNFLPQLGFMFLLLPLFPPLIAVLSLVVAFVKEAWISALASALFFGWILAAGFPLSS